MAAVQSKIHEFEQKFKALQRSTRDELEHHGVSTMVVVEHLTDLSADDMLEHKVFLESKVDILFEAEDHDELFGSMNFYWNYLAYHPLEYFITEFSLEEVKGEMEEYKDDLQKFMKETPAKVVSQTRKKKELESPPGFEKLVAKYAWPESVTLWVLEEFRQQYIHHCNLNECAMLFFAIQDDSPTIIWLIAESVVECLKMKVNDEFLSGYNVTSLAIAGTCVYFNEELQQVRSYLVSVH